MCSELHGLTVPVLLIFRNVLVQTYVTSLLKFGPNIMYPTSCTLYTFQGHVLEALLLAIPWGIESDHCDSIRFGRIFHTRVSAKSTMGDRTCGSNFVAKGSYFYWLWPCQTRALLFESIELPACNAPSNLQPQKRESQTNDKGSAVVISELVFRGHL